MSGDKKDNVEPTPSSAREAAACGDDTVASEEQGPASMPSSSSSQACLHCGKDEAMKRCSRCMEAYFCSRECQIESWPSHKADCKKPPNSEWTLSVGGPFRMGQQKIRIKPSDNAETLLVRYVRAMLADPQDPNRRILDLTNGTANFAPRGPGKRGYIESMEAPLESIGVKDGDVLEVVMAAVPGGGARGIAMTAEECVRRNEEWLQEREHIK